MANDVWLRDVTEEDLNVFFEQQLDPEANRMAAFPAWDREAFLAHWARILEDETIYKKTILFDGEVAGQIVSFIHQSEREVGYWIGRRFWGKGIATRALALFLEYVKERPLYAHVAAHNRASIRVLEKCGFRNVGVDSDFGSTGGENVEGVILELVDREFGRTV